MIVTFEIGDLVPYGMNGKLLTRIVHKEKVGRWWCFELDKIDGKCTERYLEESMELFEECVERTVT